MSSKEGSNKREEEVKRNLAFKVSGSGTITVNNAIIRISGSGKLLEDELHISGSGKIQGSLKLKSLNISGSFSCEGDLEVEEIHVSGSGYISGILKAGELYSSGSFRVDKECLVRRKIKSSGSFKAKKEIKASTLQISGSISSLDIIGEVIEIYGSIHALGNVTCKSFFLRLYGNSSISGTLRANEIDIRRAERGQKGFIIKLLGIEIMRIGDLSRGMLDVDRIEGDKIYLEHVVCNEICGNEVYIGPECRVKGKVYYRDKITVDPSAYLANPPERLS